MSRISRLERSEVTPEISALFDRIFAQRGNVPNMFRVMAHRPEIFATMQAHFAAVLSTGNSQPPPCRPMRSATAPISSANTGRPQAHISVNV